MDGRAKWHRMTAEAVCAQLHTNAAAGLNRRAARSRFKKEGANTLFDRKRSGIVPILRPLFCDPAILLMLFAAILALCFTKIATGVVFFIVLLSCVGICWRTARAALRTEECIAAYRIPSVRVVREGTLYSISARRVVRGDVLILRAGDLVPCDCRILAAQDVRVLTLTPDENGKPVYVETAKNAYTVYPYGDKTPLPRCENMLCGGSEILSGEVRAVAVEVGENTYIGAMELFSVPAEPVGKKSGSEAAHAIAPYLRVLGIGTLILLLLLAVITLLHTPDGFDGIDLFFTLCAAVGCSAPAFILFFVRMITMREPVECMQGRKGANRAILKSARASDVLSDVTDLFVIGHVGSTDGVPHFARAAIGRGEIIPDPQAPQPLLNPLCEAFFLLKMASEGVSVTMREGGEDDTAFLEELLAACDFDLPALRVRLTRATLIPHQNGVREVAVEMKERAFSLIFLEDFRMTECCTVYEDGERYCAISPALREGFYGFEAAARAECGKTVTVLRRMHDGTPALLGTVVIRETPQSILPSVCEELAQCGVRTAFFLNAQDALYADACRLQTPFVSAEETPALSELLLENHQVFMGYSTAQIANLTAQMRKNGRRVAVFCNHADRNLLRVAPLLIACDATEYHRRDTEEAALEALPREGLINSARCSQSTRRRADVLVSRASKHTGGLASVLQALWHARAARWRIAMLLSFLSVTRFSLLAACTLGLLFGTGLPGGTATFYLGAFTATVGVLWVLYAPVPQSLLRETLRFDEKTLLALIFPRSESISTIGATALTVLYAAILVWCGILPPTVAATYLFASLLLLHVGLLYDTTRGKRGALRPLWRALPALIILLPAALMLGLQAIWADTWTLVTLFSLPLCPILYVLTKICLSLFGRTAK